MCGIVYAQSFDGSPVNNGILQQFDKQRSRGTQGFGLFDGQEMNMVRAAKENKILKWLCKYNSNLILFHHRMPTSTVNVKRAAHPFSTKGYFGDDQYIMVHNGVIYNSDELFVEHQEKGMQYQSLLDDLTFNDSEALLWDLALTLEGKQPALTARGPVAFVCIKLHKGKLDKMYFGRNTNPLNLFRHKDGIALSSEGEGKEIDSHKLYTWNYKLKRLTSKDFRIPQFLSSYAESDYTPGSYADSKYDPHYYTGQFAGNSLSRLDSHRGRSGDWLPDNIKNNPKVKKYLEENNPNFLDYDREGNPLLNDDGYDWDEARHLMLPAGQTQDEFLELEDEEELEPYRPLSGQVQATALRYIIGAKGVFEVAYWKCEQDYSDTMDLNDTTANGIRESLLFEEVLEYIQCDPEYKSSTSVSSIWSQAWEQAALIG